MAIAYDRLKQHLGIAGGELLVFDTGQQLAYVEQPVREWYGADVLILDGGLTGGWRDYTLPNGVPAKICKGFHTEPDGLGGEYSLNARGRRTMHRPANSLYFDSVYHPLANASRISDLNLYKFHVTGAKTLAQLHKEAKRLHD